MMPCRVHPANICYVLALDRKLTVLSNSGIHETDKTAAESDFLDVAPVCLITHLFNPLWPSWFI